MKIKNIIFTLIYGILLLFATGAAGYEPDKRLPSAFLPERLCTFEPVAEGIEVRI